MDFRFTEEQTMIFETAASFLAEVSSSADVRKHLRTDAGFDAQVWQQVCESMYWQAILIPEAFGGLALGYVEAIGILEQMGERLFQSPFATSSVLATTLIKSLGNEQQQATLFESLLGGSIATIAYTTARPDWSVSSVSVSAEEVAESVTLQGECRFVPYAHSANIIIVAAKSVTSGISCYWLNSASEGVQIERTPTLDQTQPLGRIVFDNTVIPTSQRLGDLDQAGSVLADVLDIARIAAAADLVGVAQRSLDMSVDYAKERVQFGRTIASFQAIKHKAADMMLKAESARSLLYYAACVADEWLADRGPKQALAEAAAMVKASAAEAAFFNAGTGIQIHGGVGITEEYDIQLYFKRARAGENYLGSPTSQREVIARQLLD